MSRTSIGLSPEREIEDTAVIAALVVERLHKLYFGWNVF